MQSGFACVGGRGFVWSGSQLQIIRNCEPKDHPMRRLLLAALLLAPLAATPARADDPSFTLTIRNHVFDPARIEVPANAKFRLLVKNMDSTPEEFESKDLRREKVIAGGAEAVILLGPLKPGTYRFVGEYNEATAKGVLVAQ